MKKFIFASVVLFSICGSGRAWEHPQNPDRFPSVGLSLEGWGTAGDFSFPSNGALGSQNVEHSVGFFIFDTRLPLSDSFTLSLALGSAGERTRADATSALNSQKLDSNGGYFAISARYYFNKKSAGAAL